MTEQEPRRKARVRKRTRAAVESGRGGGGGGGGRRGGGRGGRSQAMNGRMDGEEGSFGAPSVEAAADILEKKRAYDDALCATVKKI